MPSWLEIIGKIVAKVALNGLLPGSGSAVDFIEAAHNISQGDYIGATINLGCGAFDLVTLGAVGAAKDAAQESGKQAAINAAKESAKEIGEAATKEIAKCGSNQAAVQTAIIASKSAKKEIGKRLGKEISMGVFGDVTEEAFKQSLPKVALQGGVMGLISSGGKDTTKEIIGGAANSFLNEISSRTSREILRSPTTTAAKQAVDECVKTFSKDTLKREVVFNTVKGFVQLGKRIVDGVTDSTEEAIKEALIEVQTELHGSGGKHVTKEILGGGAAL